jgi:hypothetical protein
MSQTPGPSRSPRRPAASAAAAAPSGAGRRRGARPKRSARSVPSAHTPAWCRVLAEGGATAPRMVHGRERSFWAMEARRGPGPTPPVAATPGATDALVETVQPMAKDRAVKARSARSAHGRWRERTRARRGEHRWSRPLERHGVHGARGVRTTAVPLPRRSTVAPGHARADSERAACAVLRRTADRCGATQGRSGHVTEAGNAMQTTHRPRRTARSGTRRADERAQDATRRSYELPSRWRRNSASMKASRSPSSTASTLPVS